MKKTKRQKMLADLHRKLQAAEQRQSKIEKEPVENIVKPTYVFSGNSSILVQEKIREIPTHGQIQNELRKTLMVSGFITVAIIVLKFVLK